MAGSRASPARRSRCSVVKVCRWQLVPRGDEDALEVVDDVAVDPLDAGWQLKSVALLTTLRRHPVQVERHAAGQDAYWASYCNGEDLGTAAGVGDI